MDIFEHYLDLIELAQTPNIQLINQIRRRLRPPFSWQSVSGVPLTGWKTIWLRYGKITSAMISPLKVDALTDVIYRIPGVFLVLWIEMVALIYGMLLAVKASGMELPTSTQSVSALEAFLFQLFFWAIVLLIAPAHYHHLFHFFKNPAYSYLYRGLIFLVLLVVFVLVFLAPHLSPKISVLLFGNFLNATGNIRWTDILLSVIVGLFVFIPALSYLIFLSVDLFLWAIFLLVGAWAYFVIFHESHPVQQIQRLVFEDIPHRNNPHMKWKLVDLDESELEAIRDWAEANREGTEKRLLPTIIFFSLVQLFGWNAIANTSFGQQLIGLWNQSMALITATPLGFMSVLLSVLMGVIVGLFLVPFIAIGKLFVNILPQSLIIEACIVAKHHKRQAAEPPALESSVELPLGFWDRVAFVFGYTRRKDF